MTLWITVEVSTTTAGWQLPESMTMITTMRPTWAQVTLCCGPCFTGRKGRVRMETSITHWGMCKRNQRCNCRHAHTLTHSHTHSHSLTHTLTHSHPLSHVSTGCLVQHQTMARSGLHTAARVATASPTDVPVHTHGPPRPVHLCAQYAATGAVHG